MDYRKIEGTVFNIQRYSIADGPGVRTTVFVKGCPLRCLWCSNPESQKSEREVSYRYTSCKACGKCVQVCPHHAAALSEDGVHIDRDKCAVCGACVKKCLPGALSISGKTMTVEATFNVVIRDKDYYDQGGGGCTCSGGEILMQPDFVAGLFRLCRENGIHTNADTCGYGSAEAMKKILEYSDLIFFDLKHMDSVEHKKLTGVGNEAILQNLALVADSGVELVIRVPLIPGYNDSEDNINALARAVRDMTGGRASVNILPYHRYGANKYRMLDRVYGLDGVEPPSAAELADIKKTVESYGLTCAVE